MCVGGYAYRALMNTRDTEFGVRLRVMDIHIYTPVQLSNGKHTQQNSYSRQNRFDNERVNEK